MSIAASARLHMGRVEQLLLEKGILRQLYLFIY